MCLRSSKEVTQRVSENICRTEMLLCYLYYFIKHIYLCPFIYCYFINRKPYALSLFHVLCR